MQKNPNHKEETKIKKQKEAKAARVDNSNLEHQDPNENFLELKNQLIFFQDKSKVDDFQKGIEEENRFLMINEEIDKDEVLERGIDLCILADISESIHPWRIFLKKSIYYCLIDLESFIYSIPDVSSDDFSRFRVSLVTYTDRHRKQPIEVTDFKEYKNLGDICKKIDEIEIKELKNAKRAVFDGLDAVTKLTWNKKSQKIIVHYAADAAYGTKYSTNLKSLSDDYDSFPNGCEDLDDEEILNKISELDPIFNFIKLGDRLEKYQKEVTGIINMDVCKPKVEKI